MTNVEGIRERLNRLNRDAAELAHEGEEAWEPPIPLDPVTGPPFPVDALPGMIRQLVEAVAEETQTPPDLAALVALGTISAAAGGKYVAYVPSSNWKEPVHAMFVPVAEPGSRKSGVFQHITYPLGEWEREKQETEAPIIAQWESRLRVLEKQLATAENEQGKPPKDGKLTVGDAQRMAAVEALQEHLQARPVPTEISTDDATPEAVKERIIDQGGALAVMSAESAYLSNVAGRYSNAPHLDTILNGHAGDGIKVGRRGKPTEQTQRACLTLCLMLQPQVIEDLGKIDGFRTRGAAARLLPAFPADWIGNRSITTEPVPERLVVAWRDTVRRILDTPREASPSVLNLTPEALEAFDAYRAALEPTLKSEGPHMQGWLAKLAGAVLRIAGLLHIAQSREPERDEIDVDTIRSAIAIGAYFHHHARIMFRMMYGRNGQSEAGEVLDVLRTVGSDSITKRNLYQRIKRRAAFQTVDALNPALDTLEDYGWIHREKQTGPEGGRPSEIIFLNPEIGTQNPQNPGTDLPTAGIEGIGDQTGEPQAPPNVTRFQQPNRLDPTGTDGLPEWEV